MIFDCAGSIKGELQRCTQKWFYDITHSKSVTDICREIASIVDNDDTDAEDIAELKKRLPVLVPHAHSKTGRRRGDDLEPSGLVMVDIDHIGGDPRERYLDIIRTLQNDGGKTLKDAGILLVHKTPSTHGLRVIGKRPKGVSIEEYQRTFAEKFGVEIDSVTKDLARCSFIPEYGYIYYLDNELFSDEKYEVGSAECQSQGADSDVGTSAPSVPQNLNYLGIPYAQIIDKWWELTNGGKTPQRSNRNTLIFELAVNLRHICGFDKKILDAIIPNYDGFPEQEKLQVIDSALSQKLTRMPARLQRVLGVLKADNADNMELVRALDEAQEVDEQFYIDRVPKKALPMGVRDSLDGLPKSLAMPALITIGPMIGALATKVRLDVHGDMNHLNLISYIIGEAGSNKSKMDELYELWMHNIQAQDDVQHKIEREYLDKKEQKKNSKEQPQDPKVVIRLLSLRTSISQAVTRLMNSRGQHCFSFTPECDQLSQTRTGSWSNISVLLRCSYDGSKFDTDYKDGKSTGLIVPHVLWNMSLCGTPDALYRAFSNYTNGEITRLAIARTPDNTFAPLMQCEMRGEEAKEHIRKVAVLLENMQGDVVLPLLEQRCQEWLEEVRLQTLKDFNETKARLRFRSAVTAMRYVCGFMLCAYAEWLMARIDNNKKKPKWAHGAETALMYLKSHPDNLKKNLVRFQTPEFLTFYDVMADYIIDTLMFYFAERIEKARQSANYVIGARTLPGKNDTVFSRLGDEFSLEDARIAKGVECSINSVRQMIKNWCKQGLIIKGDGMYKKTK